MTSLFGLFRVAIALSTWMIAFAADWQPLDPSLLSLTTPKVDKSADAEAVFWTVAIEDEYRGEDFSVSFSHYIRIKIFTEKGVQDHGTVEIAQFGKHRLGGVQGRTIKKDGTIVELKKDAIFVRDLVKSKTLKSKGTTFAMPNVEPGDVIEYKYKEYRDNETSNYVQLYFQRDIPVWLASYEVKPLQLDWLPYPMRSLSFNIENSKWEKSKTRANFFESHAENVPAFKSEPYMPPEDQLRGWTVLYYEENMNTTPDKFWRRLGKKDFGQAKATTRGDGAITKVAEELTKSLSTDEEKLRALDMFCRTQIRNLNHQAHTISAEERKDFKFNEFPRDTLSKKLGTGADIDRLFVALARAAGFDARMARMPDRGKMFFDPSRMSEFMMGGRSVAVRVGEAWKFYDPATPYLEPDTLGWREEGLPALISDPKDGILLDTPHTPPSRSVRKRRAKFTLAEDGTLEGVVSLEFSGHAGVEWKEQFDGMSESERLDDIKSGVTARMDTAQVSEVKVTNETDAKQPLRASYHVTIPGYATRTGKRLLLQPAYFQRGMAPMLRASDRVHALYWRYGWTEDDQIEIALPDGWELDKPTAPPSFQLADVGEYEIKLSKTVDNRKVIYNRKFIWGKDGKLLMPAAAYPQLKAVFENINEQDGHMLMLRAAAPGAPGDK